MVKPVPEGSPYFTPQEVADRKIGAWVGLALAVGGIALFTIGLLASHGLLHIGTISQQGILDLTYAGGGIPLLLGLSTLVVSVKRPSSKHIPVPIEKGEAPPKHIYKVSEANTQSAFIHVKERTAEASKQIPWMISFMVGNDKVTLYALTAPEEAEGLKKQIVEELGNQLLFGDYLKPLFQGKGSAVLVTEGNKDVIYAGDNFMAKEGFWIQGSAAFWDKIPDQKLANIVQRQEEGSKGPAERTRLNHEMALSLAKEALKAGADDVAVIVVNMN